MFNITEIMWKKHISSKQLAEMTGLSKRSIDEYRATRAKEPAFSTGILIADALGVDPHELLVTEIRRRN